jgi:hypothetical protein
MEREAGTNVTEKKRLRDAIEDQVRQYLQRGGRITVIQGRSGAPAKAAHGGVWTGAAGDGADIMAQLD